MMWSKSWPDHSEEDSTAGQQEPALEEYPAAWVCAACLGLELCHSPRQPRRGDQEVKSAHTVKAPRPSLREPRFGRRSEPFGCSAALPCTRCKEAVLPTGADRERLGKFTCERRQASW